MLAVASSLVFEMFGAGQEGLPRGLVRGIDVEGTVHYQKGGGFDRILQGGEGRGAGVESNESGIHRYGGATDRNGGEEVRVPKRCVEKIGNVVIIRGGFVGSGVIGVSNEFIVGSSQAGETPLDERSRIGISHCIAGLVGDGGGEVVAS